ESFWFSLVFELIGDIVHSRFVGLSNFRQLFDPILNPLFGPAMLHTLIWTVFQFLFVLPLSLLLAVCLTRVTRGRTLYQIAIFLPVITPLVVVALMTGKLFDPDAGAINGVLRALGLPTSQWLHDPAIALPLAAAISAWRWLGLYVIILAAGILNIPR